MSMLWAGQLSWVGRALLRHYIDPSTLVGSVAWAGTPLSHLREHWVSPTDSLTLVSGIMEHPV